MKKILLFIFFLFIAITANAQPVGGIKTWLEEEDGSPSIIAYKLKVTNATLTDNGDGSASLAVGAGHDAVTLAADADVLLGLSTQQLTLDTQTANTIFAGPGSGAAADPTFRALVDDDVPDTITLSNITQITTKSHTSLSDIGTNAHSVIDTFIASKAAASGLASLDISSLVVQNPANATATPTASKIPIADGSGLLDGWITLGASVDISSETNLAGDTEVVLTGDALSLASTITRDTELSVYAPLASPTFTGTVTIPTPFTLGATSVIPTGTELNYVDGVTSAIQTQIDSKQGTVTAGRSLTFTGATIDADAEVYTDFKGMTIETPTDADNFFSFEAPIALTITRVMGIVESATSAVLTWQECDAAGDNCVTIESVTADVDGTISTAIDNAGIDAGDIIRLDVGTVTGTVGQAHSTITFTKDD